MAKGYHHYVLDEDTDDRLCQDGLLRGFAMFGTMPGCVKVYRRKGWAVRMADQLTRGTRKFYVLSLPPGQVMDAAGKVCNED